MGAVTYDGLKYHSVGVGMDLLWKNENPTESFPAQTIALDLLNYEAVLVHSIYSASTPNESSNICFKGGVSEALVCRRASCHTREITVANDGVTFTTGYNSTPAASATACIPIAIYGLSGIC